MVEPGQRVGDGRLLLGSAHVEGPGGGAAIVTLVGEVVRQACGDQPGGLDRVDGVDHDRPHRTGQHGDDVVPVDPMAEFLGFGLEQRHEAVDTDLVAFQPGPGVVVGVGRVDRPDEPVR